MAKFTSYPNKSKPADSDTLLINDSSASANKQILLSGLFAWLKDKFTSTPINGLETTNQTIVGAINELHDAVEEGGSGGDGLTDAVKIALLQLAQKVAYIDDDGQDYYDDLYDALYPETPPASLVSISAVYTQSGTVYSDDSLDSLKSNLVVTAHYNNGTSQVLSASAYTLSGSLSSATSTLTATFSGKTATFSVSVTLVGSTEYADDLANWFLTATPGAATYSNGTISIKGSQTNANNYKLLCFDRAKTLWDTVNGKKLRIRVTMDSPDWVGEVGQQNKVIFGVSIYKNSTITTGNDRQKNRGLDSQILPASTPTTYEFIFDADISNFDSGDGTPTSESTFGAFIYNVSANRLNITDCSVVEVLTS